MFFFLLISIHALHEESDSSTHWVSVRLRQFQSTLSMRRATQAIPTVTTFFDISIHALHEESDNVYAESGFVADNFNPRSP